MILSTTEESGLVHYHGGGGRREMRQNQEYRTENNLEQMHKHSQYEAQ